MAPKVPKVIQHVLHRLSLISLSDDQATQKKKVHLPHLPHKLTHLPHKLAQCLPNHTSWTNTEELYGPDGAPLWEELPEAMWWIVFGFLDSESLKKCMYVNKRWHSLATDESLWTALLWKEWPLWAETFRRKLDRAKAQASPLAVEPRWRSEHACVSAGFRPIRVQVLNKLLTFGTFGSCFLCDVCVHPESGGYLARYPKGSREPEAEIVLPSRVRLPPPQVDPTTILEEQLDDLVVMDQHEFALMPVGTAVEIQWKGSATSPHYNWWFAVVQEVHWREDEVTLRFEQYDSMH
eukprot:CAMPEP_0118937348 /NCGR_PEP_ID=MMETSP1169-20130426/22402_1 /TAXON_ID=36882 /ORGANISM="Pyramimonas obovata, Strain CCMP722" /LENGTH=292 /DNA_ID=CAMNT_0006880941 /DNA_START=333 /DNA_END=1208 /DNA_ORIENTATION=+